ncbi:hypothetical protein QFC19_008458 [Naganishia cerealis]|uniref:Uncharacterized protein n=1 Tax=Naganishia cerealis TaxID=610337 RepID=A0ACC2V1A2_9TREE|nr:hypothetical protein QFC19_008458 [Naganishia cerealis]
MFYGERTLKEEYAAERRLGNEANEQRMGNKVANIHEPSISSGEDKELPNIKSYRPNLVPRDFQPMLIVLRSMSQTNMKSRQLRARVNELIQARFPGIYSRLGLVNFKSYSAKAEAAELVEMGRSGEGRDWIALTEKGRQLLTKK